MDAGLIPLKNCRKRAGVCALPSTIKAGSVFDQIDPGWDALRMVCKGVVRLQVKSGVRDDSFMQLLRAHTGLGLQGYRLDISPGDITLVAESDQGAFYGLHTLASLVSDHGSTLPCLSIEDSPELERRGVYLDCSRGKVPGIDTLKALIARLGSWKMNELQLYIENTFAFRKHPSISRGFSAYTPDEIIEIQDCCRQHFIRLVPSLSSFGHFERILSLPAYRHLGEKPGLWGFPGGTTLDCSNPESLELVSDLYSEFLPLFESPWFNACCDETWELGKGKNAARVKRRGVGPVYLDFIKQLHGLCETYGKQLHLWSDIVLNHPNSIPRVPKDIVMLNWDYSSRGTRIPQSHTFQTAGLQWLACPGSQGWRSHGSRLGDALANVRVFALEAKRSGAYGLLHTDWGDYGHRNTLGVSLCSMAYAAAQAWAPGKTPQKGFLERFCHDQVPSGQVDRVIEQLDLIGHLEDRVGYSVPFQSFTSGMRPGIDLHTIPPRSPVFQPTAFRCDWYTRARHNTLQDAADDLASLRSLTIEGDPWTRNFLDDVNLAVKMDHVACDRLLLARQLREGKPITVKRRAGFTPRYADMIQHFEKNWNRRNRPSRLQDNLRLLQAGFDDWRQA